MMYQNESSKINLLKYTSGIIAVGFIVIIFIKPIIAQTGISNFASITGFEESEKLNSKELDLENQKDKPILNDTSKKQESLSIITQGKQDQKKNDPQWWNSECSMNADLVFYDLDEYSRLPSCSDQEDPWVHSKYVLSKFATENFNWPQAAIREGQEGAISYNIVIDEVGNLAEILPNLNFTNPQKYGLKEEGIRIVELMRKEFKFIPGKCNGTPVRTSALFSIKLEIPASKRHLVTIKDASNTIPNQQIASGASSSCSGVRLQFNYRSNMNVAVSFQVTDPDGEVIFNESIDHIYNYYFHSLPLSGKKNGIYMITATQDGVKEMSKVDVDIFENPLNVNYANHKE